MLPSGIAPILRALCSGNLRGMTRSRAGPRMNVPPRGCIELPWQRGTVLSGAGRARAPRNLQPGPWSCARTRSARPRRYPCAPRWWCSHLPSTPRGVRATASSPQSPPILPARDARNLARAQQPPPAPAASQPPRLRRRDGRRIQRDARGRTSRARNRSAPAVEPAVRPSGVEACGETREREATEAFGKVAAGVQEDVRERVPDFVRRRERARVEAIGEDGAAAAEGAPRCARDAGGDGLHAAAEGDAVARFDDQVDVVGLDRVVDEAEAPALAGAREAALDLAHADGAAQRRESRSRLQRDVERRASRECGSRRVGHRRARLPRAPGSRAATAPAARGAKIERELSSIRSHDTSFASRCDGSGHDYQAYLEFGAVFSRGRCARFEAVGGSDRCSECSARRHARIERAW
jgi:hypothetical protein